MNRTIATRLSASRSRNVYFPYRPGVRFFLTSCTAENAATAMQIKANKPSSTYTTLMPAARANGFASGVNTPSSSMLITVIKTATLPVKTSQMPSIVDERHISDGKNASATTRYRMPKPTSTHFTHIASPRHPQY